MMKKLSYLFVTALIFVQCDNPIKEENIDVIEEEGTEIVDSAIAIEEEIEPVEKYEHVFSDDEHDPINGLIGYWVGGFFPANENDGWDKAVIVDDGFIWNRVNKINISIDRIEEEKVFGHSVVAGNDRPFEGTVTENGVVFKFEVKEPGDDKYDGTFYFTIENGTLQGSWEAYKEIEIAQRKYKLSKMEFKYDPDAMLEPNGPFVNWEKFKTAIRQYDEEYSEEYKEFETATDAIYEINASNKLLTKKDVENLKNGDLVIIRNMIYVRHGYSFKTRPLRVFFDAQSWYVPVYNNIKTELTDIEIKNIELLLRYEKNAKEYYDSFGRG